MGGPETAMAKTVRSADGHANMVVAVAICEVFVLTVLGKTDNGHARPRSNDKADPDRGRSPKVRPDK